MQTIFRLPWSTEPSSDEALADRMYSQKPRYQKQPRIEIPLLTATNAAKRKRMDSLDISVKTAHQIKKLKSENDGAVQPTLEPVKVVDGITNPLPRKPIGHCDTTVKLEPSSSVTTETAQPGGNVVAQLANQVTTKGKEPVTIGLQGQPHNNLSSPASDSYKTPISTVKQEVMADPADNVEKIRAIIDAHLSLEILHKHNELRLIEQELAKCQVSLEQLRRCELIPYPGATGPSSAVTKGVGKALKSPAGYSTPTSPAPWGVTDGPYARHYAKWLLPDAQFDAMSAHSYSSVGTPMTTRGIRATRGSGFDFHLPAPPARTSRTSAGNRQDPSTPTGGRDPMIMKRQADGEWVKLKCNVCHRSNFNNIQGFLNHCRIAHHQDYKSHEAAAIACGDVVQVDEATFATDPAPTPREPPPSRASSVVVPAPTPLTSLSFCSTPMEQPYVNPLVLQTPAHKPLDRVVGLSNTPNAERPKPSLARSSFKGTLAPHLSALMQRRGLSTSDMPSFIADAKKKVDLSVYDESDSEQDRDGKNKKHKQKKAKSAGSRHPTSGSSAPLHQVRPASAKGTGRQAPLAIAPPSASRFDSGHDFAHSIPETPSDGDVEMELSPGTAPGLVSDHDDDYDDQDEARSDTNGGHHEVEDVEIRDASDVEREERKRVRHVADAEQVCRQQGQGGLC